MVTATTSRSARGTEGAEDCKAIRGAVNTNDGVVASLGDLRASAYQRAVAVTLLKPIAVAEQELMARQQLKGFVV